MTELPEGLSRNKEETELSDSTKSPTEPLETFDNLKAVYWNERDFGKKFCCVCGYEKETSWVAETFKDELKPLCEDCVQVYQKEREVKP